MSDDKINLIKSYIRDINLGLLTDNKLEFDIKNGFKYPFYFFTPNKKVIKYVTKIGGVLIGSRAIKAYKINGLDIIDRKLSDWDFIITQEMAFKVVDHFKVPEYNLVDKFINFEKQRWYSNPSYGSPKRYGVVDVHLIIKDELPEYKQEGDMRVCGFNYVINEKFKMIEDIQLDLKRNAIHYRELEDLGRELTKHVDDLTNIIIKFNSNSNGGK